MNKAIASLNPIHVFLFCLLLAAIPRFLFVLIAFAFWLMPVFVLVCVIDYFKGTIMRQKAGLILASIFLASIFGLVISYFISVM